MRKVYVFVITVLISIPVFSTGQTADILMYEGNEYALLDTPLESYPKIESLRGKFFGNNEGGFSTSCWRAYVAEWTIIDRDIFLTNIYSCDYYTDSLKSNLEELFGEKCIDGKVKADWISKELLVANGKMILYHNDGFRYFYDKEKGFLVEKGNLVEVVDYDNSKTKKSEYFDNPKLLVPFIYSNIRWDSLPDVTDKNIRVIVTFLSGATETPENITVVRGSNNPAFNVEAKRVIGLLKWNVYYKRRKAVHLSYTIPVVFSQENKNKHYQLKYILR